MKLLLPQTTRLAGEAGATRPAGVGWGEQAFGALCTELLSARAASGRRQNGTYCAQ